MPDARPWPFSRLDYRIESGRVFLDDGRTYPATTLEEELHALLVEAAERIEALQRDRDHFERWHREVSSQRDDHLRLVSALAGRASHLVENAAELRHEEGAIGVLTAVVVALEDARREATA